MNFKAISDERPEDKKVALFLVIDDVGCYEIITGYIDNNQLYLPDGYPLTDLKPVSWHELPTLPEECRFVWET